VAVPGPGVQCTCEYRIRVLGREDAATGFRGGVIYSIEGIDMSHWFTKEHENGCYFVMPEVVVGHPFVIKRGFLPTDCGKDGFWRLFSDQMKSKIQSCIVFLLITATALSSFCSSASAIQKNDSPITVTDFRGKTLTFKKPPERIVCLIESALSGIYMLGAEKQVAGISTNVYQGNVYSYYAAMDARIKNKTIPAPGNWDFVSIESVIALRPDVVILWSNQTESITALEERGIRVFGVFIDKKEDVYKEILELGKLTGRSKRAQELVDYTKKEIERFHKRVASIPPANRQRVYYMWAQGNLETSCGESTVQDLIHLAGGKNVCDSLSNEHIVVNMEQIMAWNPDIIVMWYNEKKNPSDIIDDEQWRFIQAVKKRRVHEFPEIFLCDLWTLKYTYAVKMVAKWTYPQLFKDIDLEKEKRTMLQMLYGKKAGNSIP
jgi:iron complex transport system substrate-binding protein